MKKKLILMLLSVCLGLVCYADNSGAGRAGSGSFNQGPGPRMFISVNKDVSVSELRKVVKQVCSETVNRFFKNNPEWKSRRIFFTPLPLDFVDGSAAEFLEDVITTEGRTLGFQVVSGEQVRNAILKRGGGDQDLEGIVKRSTVMEIGHQLGASIMVKTKLVVIDEWDSEDPKVTIELQFAPWDMEKAVRLPAQGADPYIGVIKPAASFMEKHTKTVLYVVGGLLGLVLLIYLIRRIIEAG